MFAANKIMRAGALVLLCLASGCALVDQKVPLTYNQAMAGVHSESGGDVYVETPVCSKLETNKKGLCIVGNVKNSYGMKTADTVTSDSVPQWIGDALCKELAAAGFTPKMVDKLPPEADRAVCTRVIKVWVDQDPGFFTVGAIGEVQLRMALYQGGKSVKEFDVESKGQGDRSIVGDANTKEGSLKVALEACMKEAIPVVVAMFKE